MARNLSARGFKLPEENGVTKLQLDTAGSHAQHCHCDRVWSNGTQNARARRNSQDALHELHSSELGKTEPRWGRDLSETQCEVVAKQQLPLNPSRKDTSGWVTPEGVTELHAFAEMVQMIDSQMEKMWYNAKNKDRAGEAD